MSANYGIRDVECDSPDVGKDDDEYNGVGFVDISKTLEMWDDCFF